MRTALELICCLQDDAMLFITLKSAEAEQVPKVLQVVEETKRIRHKAGMYLFCF